MNDIKITIDYQKMSEFKVMFGQILHQLQNDYIAENGSKLLKEDADIAASICLLTKSYKVTKNK
jgi:hypothetical protein